MKKSFLILLYLVFSYQAFAQLDLDDFYKKIVPNVCFGAIPEDTNVLSKQYLQIIPPTFDTTWIETTERFLVNHFSKEELTSKKPLKLKVTSSYFRYIKDNRNYACLSLSYGEPNSKLATILCLKEKSPYYLYLQKDSIIINGTMTYQVKKQLIPQVTIHKASSLKIINETEALHSKYSVFPLFQGQYQEWKGLYCTCQQRTYDFEEVQYALIAAGYTLQINGQMNAITRKALIDYQKKHNLPIGRLDTKTVKKLCPICSLPPVLVKIQRRLNLYGYDIKINGLYDKSTQDALFNFQKKHGLKAGALDYETLERLGINY